MMIEKLKQYGQNAVAAALEKLTGDRKQKLDAQLKELDFEELNQLIRDYVMKKPGNGNPRIFSPAPFLPFPATDDAQKAYYETASGGRKRLPFRREMSPMLVVGRA